MAEKNAHSPLSEARTGRRRKIYILPTGFGLVYGGGVFLMLLLSFVYQNNLAYALTFFLMSFGLVVMLQTHRVVARLGIRGRFPAPVYALREFDPPVSVERVAESGLMETGALEEVFFRPPRTSALRSCGKHWLALHRGIFELTRVEVHSLYPLGFFRAWKKAPLSLRLVVAAAPVDHGLTPGRGSKDESDGAGDRASSGEPDEIADLSAGRAEDPPALMDWRAFARGRGWQKKNFLAFGEGRRLISWKDTEPLADTEKRLEQMSAWILSVQERRDDVLVELPDGRRTASLSEALAALSVWEEVN